MNRHYLITLTPMDWFFFGGERTLDDGKSADYISYSNKFPQQSALLGMIRYQLLKQHNLLSQFPYKENNPTEKEMIKALIGEQSFRMTERKADSLGLGVIKQISPLMLVECKNDTSPRSIYLPLPLDDGYKVSFNETSSADRVFYNGIECPIPNVYLASGEQDSDIQEKFFDHKTYNNYLFWCTQENNQIKKLLSDEIWISKMQIGITKHVEEGENNDKSFYKQEFLQLKKTFMYAFYITLSEESELSSDIIQLGGQRSVFRMEVEVIEENSDIQKKHQAAAQFLAQSDRLLILSPTYVDNLKDLSALCNFMWSDSIVFRNIQTTNASNFYGKPIKSSSKYHFLKPGSVLYFKQGKREEVEKLLMDYTYLRLSGYNTYI